ncbi:MAG: HlyD family secretion protein [Anaerolineales bacterium]
MKNKLVIHGATALVTLMGLTLLFTACAPAGQTPTAEVIPTVIADSTIIAEGRLEPVRYAEIAFNASGVVSEVLVEEGQPVKKGEVLILLGGESDNNYAAAQVKLVNAQKALNDLHNEADADFAQAVIDLKQAKEDHKEADQYLNYLKNSPKVPIAENFLYYIDTNRHNGYNYRIRTKFSKGPAPAGWITQAENDLALRKAEMEKAQLTYDRMKDSGVDKDQLAVLEAQLNAAKAAVAAFEVVAPFDGVATDLNAKAGSSISAGKVAVTIADFSKWLVTTTDLTEIDVVHLTENDPVVVALDALPDVKLNGTILSIGQTFIENQGDVVYEVSILLTDTHPAMRWGMTSSVSFESSE